MDNITNDNRPHYFKKGASGNPLGRPKKIKCIPDILARIGKIIAPDDIQKKMRRRFHSKEKLTMQQAVLMMTYDLAAHGTQWAVEFIAERTEGKVVQMMDGSTATNGPLVLIQNLTKIAPQEKVIEGVIVDADPLPPAPQTQAPQDP